MVDWEEDSCFICYERHDYKLTTIIFDLKAVYRFQLHQSAAFSLYGCVCKDTPAYLVDIMYVIVFMHVRVRTEVYVALKLKAHKTGDYKCKF